MQTVLRNQYMEVFNFLIDSIGSNVSATNIANRLKANKKSIDNKTVSKYIDSLVESYLFIVPSDTISKASSTLPHRKSITS